MEVAAQALVPAAEAPQVAPQVAALAPVLVAAGRNPVSLEFEEKDELDVFVEETVKGPVVTVEVQTEPVHADTNAERALPERSMEDVAAAAVDSDAFAHLIEETVTAQENRRILKRNEPLPNDRFEDTPEGFEQDFFPDSAIGQDMDDAPAGDDDYIHPFDGARKADEGSDEGEPPPGGGGGGGGGDDDDDEKKPSKREEKRREAERIQQIVDHTFYNPD